MDRKLILREEIQLIIESLQRKIKFMKIQTNLFDKNFEEIDRKIDEIQKETSKFIFKPKHN